MISGSLKLSFYLLTAFNWLQLACLHDQNKSGFFGGPAFIKSIITIKKSFQKAP